MTRRRPHPAREELGTTLLELVIALAIVGVLLVGLVLSWRQGLVAYLQSSETVELQQEARIAHLRLVEELRLAGMNPCNQPVPGGEPNDPVAVAQETTVTITYFSRGASDPRGDVDCTAAGAPLAYRKVTYDYDATGFIVRRNANDGAGPQPLTGDTIQAFSLAYLDCNRNAIALTGTPPAVPAGNLGNIVLITVTVTANQDFAGGSLSRQVVSNVRLRSNTTCPGGL